MRPAGFLGARPAHVGYENLSHVIADPVRVSAQDGEWRELPKGAGRSRADSLGRVITSASGPHGGGFAVCLDCGRAEAMEMAQTGVPEPLPRAIMRHRPLLKRRSLQLTKDGLCHSANAQHRIQRHVHLAREKKCDVWEWQLPTEATEESARTLAAALREALSERLGVEPAEIIPSSAVSTGVAMTRNVSRHFCMTEQLAGRALPLGWTISRHLPQSWSERRVCWIVATSAGAAVPHAFCALT